MQDYYRIMRPLINKGHTVFKNISFSFVIISCFMHVFCCGIPLLLSITSVAAMLGVAGVKTFKLSWFIGSIEPQILMISGAILTISLAGQFISNRLDCHTDGHCIHEPCDKKKTFSERLLIIAVCLYVINLLVFFVLH